MHPEQCTARALVAVVSPLGFVAQQVDLIVRYSGVDLAGTFPDNAHDGRRDSVQSEQPKQNRQLDGRSALPRFCRAQDGLINRRNANNQTSRKSAAKHRYTCSLDSSLPENGVCGRFSRKRPDHRLRYPRVSRGRYQEHAGWTANDRLVNAWRLLLGNLPRRNINRWWRNFDGRAQRTRGRRRWSRRRRRRWWRDYRRVA